MVDISVIIPTYNRKEQLKKALSYFDNKFYENNELIVVDDFSIDGTEELILSHYKDVRYFKHSKNRGAAAARNTGIKNAKGNLIAFLDSDDEWLMNKLALQKQFLLTFPETVGACSTAYYLNRTSSIRGATKIDFKGEIIDWFDYFLKGCFISPGSTLMIHKFVFEDIGLFDESLKRLEDWDWLLRFSQKYKMCIFNLPLARINVGDPPQPNMVLTALKEFQDKWIPQLTRLQQRQLLTSIQIEKLSIYKKNNFLCFLKNISYFTFSNVYITLLVLKRIGERVFFKFKLTV